MKNGPAKTSRQINSSNPIRNIVKKKVVVVNQGMKIIFL